MSGKVGDLLEIVVDAQLHERPERLARAAQLLDDLNEKERKAAFHQKAREAEP